ncbi:murein hydrolase activator EnvC family protein [Buchnera aphidicola]|uniref:murein hydrolase activator EnvC family protein n=1 Tax=Buchnera aphidicola TaxID=9 RepID=UPI003D18E4AB
MSQNSFHKPYKILVGQKILVNDILVVNKNKINYIIFSNSNKKNILSTICVNKQINIINLLNKNILFKEICLFYNKNYHEKNNIIIKKHIFSEHWFWPVKNTRMSFFYNYSANNQGLEIEGVQGQSVFSVAKGKVVYIGDTFKNYGKLIIIKHANNYLSMYGFNKNIFIKLNDQVSENQKISTIGCLDNHLSKLYFEIRFKGNPINLLKLFPNIKLKQH